jgi:uncharacterized tellurite resistance protein B-like protein
MIDRVKQFFGRRTPHSRRGKQGEDFCDARIAACALFLEMSAVDGEFGDEERELILSALQGQYGVPKEDAVALMEHANHQREGSIDLWQFTNRINENYTMEEKLRVIEIVWEIAYADGLLDKHEDYLVHKLADLLRLTHRQLIEAKLAVKNRVTSQR